MSVCVRRVCPQGEKKIYRGRAATVALRCKCFC